MGSKAEVTSLDALRSFRVALVQYDASVRDGLDSLATQVQRAVEWLEVDRRQYWPEQARRANEKLSEARNALERCQLRYGSEEAPSCYEQKKAVDETLQRLRYCEEKVRATRSWIATVRQELNEFQGQLAKMNNCLDGDLPRAVTALERMIAALEKYVEVGTASRPRAEPPAQHEDREDESDQA